jgi:hypothetical protein
LGLAAQVTHCFGFNLGRDLRATINIANGADAIPPDSIVFGGVAFDVVPPALYLLEEPFLERWLLEIGEMLQLIFLSQLRVRTDPAETHFWTLVNCIWCGAVVVTEMHQLSHRGFAYTREGLSTSCQLRSPLLSSPLSSSHLTSHLILHPTISSRPTPSRYLREGLNLVQLLGLSLVLGSLSYTLMSEGLDQAHATPTEHATVGITHHTSTYATVRSL